MSDKLKHTYGRIIVRVDIEFKNNHTFADGKTIRIERDYNNFNSRETKPVQGIVIDSEYIPSGAILLFNHNSAHDVNEVLNHSELSGTDIASGIKVYSIPETECFLWKLKGEDIWNPTKGFAIAERVFKPYSGIIEGIPPTKLKNILYIKSGELCGNVVHTLKAADYEIVFRNESGVEERIIRCRHFEDEYNEREEITAIAHDLTEKLQDGELLIGLSESTAKPLNSIAYAD